MKANSAFYDTSGYIGCANELKPEDTRLPLYQQQFEQQGFDDTVTWNMDMSIAQWITPRLRRFKEINNCIPTDIATEEEWDIILSKIISTFELLSDEANVNDVSSASINEGLDLFRKHYFDLWW